MTDLHDEDLPQGEPRPASPYYFDLPYNIHYTNKEPVPVETIARALVAQKALIRRTNPFLRHAFPDIKVEEVDVLVEKVQAGSLIEDLVIRLIFKEKIVYEHFMDTVGNVVEASSLLTGAVCVGVAAYIWFGVKRAHSRQEGPPDVHITAFKSIIAQQASTINIKETDLDAILEGVSDKTKLSKQAILALSPAQAELGATMRMSGAFQDRKNSIPLEFDANFIQEAPTVYPEYDPSRQNEMLTNEPIEILASDAQRFNKGWAGYVPGSFKSRVRFELDEGVDPNALHGLRQVRADIVITRELKQDKGYVPILVKIFRLCKAEGESR